MGSQVLKLYTGFSGRSKRKQYWMFALFNFIFCIVAITIDNILGTTAGELHYGIFYCIYILAVSIPGIAVTIRRLHDAGKCGWFCLIVLIPIIGPVWILVLL